MAFIPTLSCAEVQLVFSEFGQTLENTLYFDMTAGDAVPDLVTLAGHVKAWWIATQKPIVAADLSLVKVLAASIAFEGAPGIVDTTGLPSAGGYVSPGMPTNVVLSVTFNTVLRGKSYRGRNYVGGLVEDNCVGNQVVAGWVAEVHANYATLITDAAGWGTPWVVVSRYHNKAARAAGVMTPVTAISGDANIDSMRRRLTGRGST